MMQGRIKQLWEQYDYFVAKFGALTARFTAWQEWHYRVECAWCQQRIGWKRKTPSVPIETSHGICGPCASRLLRDL